MRRRTIITAAGAIAGLGLVAGVGARARSAGAPHELGPRVDVLELRTRNLERSNRERLDDLERLGELIEELARRDQELAGALNRWQERFAELVSKRLDELEASIRGEHPA